VVRDQAKEAARLVGLVRKAIERESAALLMREGGFARVTQVMPTGIGVLDHHVFGIGGLPYGQVVELSGEDGAGKTTLLCRIMAAAQRDGATVAFADAETKFNPDWGKLHGLDLGTLVQLQPDTLEEFFLESQVLVAKAARGPLVIALDSVAMINTERELQEGKEPQPAEHAALWTKWLRVWKKKLAERQALLVLVNQVRDKVGVMYGPKETTFAGRCMRHSCILRLRVNHGKSIKSGEIHVGRYMGVTAFKNQVAPPFRTAQLKLDYLAGFDDAWSTVEHAKEVGCIAKAAGTDRLAEAEENLGWRAAS
jgi:recombination protein RecA